MEKDNKILGLADLSVLVNTYSKHRTDSDQETERLLKCLDALIEKLLEKCVIESSKNELLDFLQSTYTCPFHNKPLDETNIQKISDRIRFVLTKKSSSKNLRPAKNLRPSKKSTSIEEGFSQNLRLSSLLPPEIIVDLTICVKKAFRNQIDVKHKNFNNQSDLNFIVK